MSDWLENKRYEAVNIKLAIANLAKVQAIVQQVKRSSLIAPTIVQKHIHKLLLNLL